MSGKWLDQFVIKSRHDFIVTNWRQESADGKLKYSCGKYQQRPEKNPQTQ